ncbi:MAG: adenine deaminase [Bacillota bacterium]
MASPVSPEALLRLERFIDVSRGSAPADLLLVNTVMVNVFSGETERTNIAIVDGMVAGTGPQYREAREVWDLCGLYSIPGLIDAHVHIESSMVSVDQYARAVIPRGTTAIVADPHEIANVLGSAGIRYILDSSENLPLDVFVLVPSAVPATHLETAGASIGPSEVQNLLSLPRVLGLAELMNFPGVLMKDPAVLQKVLLARGAGKTVDGHAPLLSGMELNAYLGVGVATDHECTQLDEAQEKLRAGASIIIREGSAARNLEGLLPLITHGNYHRVMLGTDDRHPEDLLQDGHMDHVLRRAVSLGLDPLRAIQLSTFNTARHYGLGRRGAIAPGYAADIAIVSDLAAFEVKKVLKNGVAVAEGGELLEAPRALPPPVSSTLRLKDFSPERLAIPHRGGEVRVIQALPGQIITGQSRVTPLARNGLILADPARDILKLAVVERHRGTGNVGTALVRGFGLKRGALASSYAHDSHNIIVVGCDDTGMATAVRALEEMGGGLAAVEGAEVKARLPLPIAGMLSDKGIAEVTGALRALHAVARDLGCTLPGPFGTLSFLALPVIPELKLTDKGLVDVGSFQLVGLEA